MQTSQFVARVIATALMGQSSLLLDVGQGVPLSVTPFDGGNIPQDGCVPKTWTTSNAAIVTVDSSGYARAISAGSATISVTTGGQSAGVAVTVGGAPATFALTMTASGTGNGAVSSTPAGISCTANGGVATGTCTMPYTSGTVVTLTASPAAGHTFAGWAGACACTGTGSCQVTMSQARSVSVTFTAPVIFANVSAGRDFTCGLATNGT